MVCNLSAQNVQIEKIFRFSSDVGIVILGKQNGVAASLKSDNPHMLDMHCVAYQLALSSLDAAHSIQEEKYYEFVLHSLHSYFSRSNKRLGHLKIWQNILDDPDVKPLPVHQIHLLNFAKKKTNKQNVSKMFTERYHHS